LNLKPHKVKQCGPGAKYMFINFANEEERDKAIAALDGFMFKGRKLKAFKSRQVVGYTRPVS
jgi:RNA recognition motif-containing protein